MTYVMELCDVIWTSYDVCNGISDVIWTSYDVCNEWCML